MEIYLLIVIGLLIWLLTLGSIYLIEERNKNQRLKEQLIEKEEKIESLFNYTDRLRIELSHYEKLTYDEKMRVMSKLVPEGILIQASVDYDSYLYFIKGMKKEDLEDHITKQLSISLAKEIIKQKNLFLEVEIPLVQQLPNSSFKTRRIMGIKVLPINNKSR